MQSRLTRVASFVELKAALHCKKLVARPLAVATLCCSVQACATRTEQNTDKWQ